MSLLGSLSLSSAAAAVYAVLALGALPKYPDRLPWAPWISWAALILATGSFLGWFCVCAVAVYKLRSVRHIVVRGALLAGIFVLACFASFGPLILERACRDFCGMGNECGAFAQGFVAVLHVTATQIGVWQ